MRGLEYTGIDLFGARVEQLPLIWAELIAAGFESGHAYGKAMRTVKSCVGSSWCRFGVQDSVALAIELENRYRGLRAPHKIKLGVSGCARECAEAQSKDVGVIASVNGWNLYVCGNGGMKPRHAERGLQYLQAVVCQDSLGIAAELESDLARVIASYECEWKRAISDPATLRRFRHFINTDAGDPDISFVQERGQARPAMPLGRRPRAGAAV